jgi:hypothetical protein
MGENYMMLGTNEIPVAVRGLAPAFAGATVQFGRSKNSNQTV